MVSVTTYEALMSALPSVGPARQPPWPLRFSGWKKSLAQTLGILNWL